MNVVDFVFFDIDGTIVDSTHAILEAFQQAFDQLDLVHPGESAIQNEFGKSLNHIIQIFDVPTHLRTSFVDIFTQTELQSDNFVIYKGMRDVLELVISKDLPIILVTSKRRKTAKHILDTLDLSKLVDVLVSADDVKRTKPDPEPLLLAANRANIDLESSIMYIGDTIFDIQAAKAVGITPIGVLWGAHNKKLVDTYPNEILISSPEKLHAFLQEIL